MAVQYIPKSFIQEVVNRTDLIALIQTRVALKKRGQDYWGLCPFHEEKTPSFTASPQKQFYYCFGCQAHGNAIQFLTTFDRMEFTEAVQYLSERLGLEIPNEVPESPAQTTKDYQLLKEATQYYQGQLKISQSAIQYLKSRGITAQSARQFALGYAPILGDHLQSLISSTSDETHWVANGLLIKKDKARPGFARFRNRLMFPIRDIKGSVIAFGGRSLGSALPKYINSPETPLFHKSYELYGLYEARLASRSLTRLLVVEGYLDVISLHQYQIPYAVATMGTAINARHLQKLLRYTRELIYCFDGDRAGQQAAWRALEVSLPVMRDEIRIRFLFLPPGEDPDSYVRQVGQAEFEKKIQESLPLSEVFIHRLEAEIPIRSPEDKALFAKRALEGIEALPRGLFRQFLINRVGTYLSIDPRELSQGETPAAPAPPELRRSKAKSKLPPIHLAIALLLQCPQLASKMRPLPNMAEMAVPGVGVLDKLIDFLKNHPTRHTGEVLAAFDIPEENALLSQLAVYPPSLSKEEEVLAELHGVLARLKSQEMEYRIEILIEKAKIDGLSPGEQRTLHQLLIQVKE